MFAINLTIQVLLAAATYVQAYSCRSTSSACEHYQSAYDNQVVACRHPDGCTALVPRNPGAPSNPGAAPGHVISASPHVHAIEQARTGLLNILPPIDPHSEQPSKAWVDFTNFAIADVELRIKMTGVKDPARKKELERELLDKDKILIDNLHYNQGTEKRSREEITRDLSCELAFAMANAFRYLRTPEHLFWFIWEGLGEEDLARIKARSARVKAARLARVKAARLARVKAARLADWRQELYRHGEVWKLTAAHENWMAKGCVDKGCTGSELPYSRGK